MLPSHPKKGDVWKGKNGDVVEWLKDANFLDALTIYHFLVNGESCKEGDLVPELLFTKRTISDSILDCIRVGPLVAEVWRGDQLMYKDGEYFEVKE